MKLATLNDGSRDGALILVNRRGDRFTRAGAIAGTLQGALDQWDAVRPRLESLAAALQAGSAAAEPIDFTTLLAPLPRAYEWVDGSAYLSHITLVRKARGVEPPKSLRSDPLVYQGGSGVLLAPRAPLPLPDPEWGMDFESEVAIVLGDTPRGVKSHDAAGHVRLLLLANDVTHRNLVPAELDKGFGFFCSKPATAFSPFAVTPDELGPAWRGGRVHLRLRTFLNGTLVGDPDAGDAMHFSFFDLVEHLTKTRSFTAGTILGGGTVSNEDPARGVSCLVERRIREKLVSGASKTPYLRIGDRVRIEMIADDGNNLFGSIEQDVVAP